MKKQILGLVFAVLTAGTSFAMEILPVLNDLVLSKIDDNVKLISLSPNTPLAVEKFIQLSLGGAPNQLVIEWTVGPSSMHILSSLLEVQKKTRQSCADVIG